MSWHGEESTDSKRAGVTLTEVLMSLMIMGIGITSVATLFPISAVRSAQATKNTNAAILKYNVEGILESRPWLVYDPNNDGNFLQHFRNPSTRNYVVDPVGFFTRLRTADPADGNVTNSSFGLITGTTGTFEDDEQFVTDPTSPFHLQRWSGGTTSAINAAEAASLGDTWTVVVDEFLDDPSDVIIEAGAVVGIVLPAGVTVPELLQTLGVLPTTVTVFSIDNRFSEKLAVTAISTVGDQIFFRDTPLPFPFGGQVGRVVVETKQNSDYHWLLTVRREGDGRTSGVDVVILFGNGRNPDDERMYPATFVAGANRIGIGFPADADPVVKRGGYVFDVQNARWYRVSDTEPGNATYDIVVRTQDTIAVAGGEDQADLNGGLTAAEDANGNGILDPGEDTNGDGRLTPAEDINGDGALQFGRAILMPHVIDVFPLGSFPVPSAVTPRNF